MSAHDCVQSSLAAALRAPALPVAGGDFAHGGGEAERRMAVHRNTFIVSLVDALADAFPVSQALVGEPFFRAMARERVLADPPRSPVLTDYARGMPDFIAVWLPLILGTLRNPAVSPIRTPPGNVNLGSD